LSIWKYGQDLVHEEVDGGETQKRRKGIELDVSNVQRGLFDLAERGARRFAGDKCLSHAISEESGATAVRPRKRGGETRHMQQQPPASQRGGEPSRCSCPKKESVIEELKFVRSSEPKSYR